MKDATKIRQYIAVSVGALPRQGNRREQGVYTIVLLWVRRSSYTEVNESFHGSGWKFHGGSRLEIRIMLKTASVYCWRVLPKHRVEDALLAGALPELEFSAFFSGGGEGGCRNYTTSCKRRARWGSQTTVAMVLNRVGRWGGILWTLQCSIVGPTQ